MSTQPGAKNILKDMIDLTLPADIAADVHLCALQLCHRSQHPPYGTVPEIAAQYPDEELFGQQAQLGQEVLGQNDDLLLSQTSLILE